MTDRTKEALGWLEGQTQNECGAWHSDSEIQGIARAAMGLIREMENDMHHMGLIIEEYEKEMKKGKTA